MSMHLLLLLSSWSYYFFNPIDTGSKLNVHKAFKRRPGRLMYVQFTSCVYWENMYLPTSQNFDFIIGTLSNNYSNDLKKQAALILR